MDFMEVVRNRRSVRKFWPEEVVWPDIEEILDAAHLAPSAKNLQPWKFIIVRNEKRRRLLAQASGQEFIGEAPVIVVACATGKGGFIGRYMESWPIDVAIAMDHLTLAAWNKNLGTCWIGDFDENKIKEICSIPEEIRVVALTPLGYPVKNPQPTPRRPLEKVVSQETYS